MRLIVQTDYDMLMLKNLLEVNIFSKILGAFTEEFVDDTDIKTLKFLNAGMYIEFQLIPEYKTEYRTIENSRADDLIYNKQELIREYKERQRAALCIKNSIYLM